MRIAWQFLWVILFPLPLFSQTISGKIENTGGEKILFANVVVKDSPNAVMIRQFVIAKDGRYSIALTHPYRRFVIEVTASGYIKDHYLIDSLGPNQEHHQDFTLAKEIVNNLAPVVVKARSRLLQISGDTVNYSVASYRDGSERKIQDIIKNLPGIQVNEKTGEIRYKNKPVETVKLDGDDLFASNYAIGTKNINVDMVERVQAIENYTSNPLLKGIESGDKVALNLILKKGKTDYSGSVEAGLGGAKRFTPIDASANLLGVSQRYKAFATLSLNNVGANNTPFDYFSYTPGTEQNREAAFLAKRYLPDTYFSIALNDRRSNINNLFFGSYNAAFKMGSKTSVRTNVYYLHDKIQSSQAYINKNSINGTDFITSDVFGLRKTPLQYQGETEVKYNTSTRSLLEYNLKYRKEQISTFANVVQNDAYYYSTRLLTDDAYLKQMLTYTRRQNETKAWQVVATQTFNKAPQTYGFTPAAFDPTTSEKNMQFSRFKKATLGLQAALLGGIPNAKYSLTGGTALSRSDFYSWRSDLINGSQVIVSNFMNEFRYNESSAFLTATYKWQARLWRFAPAFTASYLEQSLSDTFRNKNKKKNNYLLEPSVSVGYRINDISALSFTAAYRQRPFAENYLVSNPVIISNRTLKSSEVSLNLQHTQAFSLFYVINNLYRQFRFNFGGVYTQVQGNYFTALTIEQSKTRMVDFYLPRVLEHLF
jgi:hypothetical protein